MKLLLVVMLGLVALATTTAQDSDDFNVLDDGAEPDDLDIDELEKIEASGKPMEVLKDLLNSSHPAYSLRKKMKTSLPDAYWRAMASRNAMFDVNSANNTEQEDSRNNTDTTTASPTTSVPRANAAVPPGVLASRPKPPIPTILNYCPHRNYLLQWFYLRVGTTITDYCYVPWAASQAITYAKCTQRYCWKSCKFQCHCGSCRPTCYQRRSIYVMCYNFHSQWWYWRWVVRNLPQGCGCSWCSCIYKG